MSSTQIRIRLVALVAVAVIGVAYITMDVLGFRFGAQPFPVTVMLPRGGGLYADGFVTYRGVDVGRITSLKLASTGAVAQLAIDPGTRIPANVTAHVRELSVAGEQYLDLVPRSAAGPLLHAGSRIGEASTYVPVSVFTLLNDAGQLISSVNSGDVRTITDALGIGFAGTGSDLRAIATAAQKIVGALQAARAATVTILTGGSGVLSSALASGSDIEEISQSLNVFTAQLRASDGDVRALIAEGVPAENALDETIQQDGTAITQLIQHLATLSDVAISRQPAVQVLLSELPIFVQRIASTVSGGSVGVQIYYNNANTVCPYDTSTPPASPTSATGAPALDRSCSLSAPDLLQRGEADVPARARS